MTGPLLGPDPVFLKYDNKQVFPELTLGFKSSGKGDWKNCGIAPKIPHGCAYSSPL